MDRHDDEPSPPVTPPTGGHDASPPLSRQSDPKTQHLHSKSLILDETYEPQNLFILNASLLCFFLHSDTSSTLTVADVDIAELDIGAYAAGDSTPNNTLHLLTTDTFYLLQQTR